VELALTAFDQYEIAHAGRDLAPPTESPARFRDGDELVEGSDRCNATKAIAEDCGEECQCVRRGDG
jgi:hypothetical protein